MKRLLIISMLMFTIASAFATSRTYTLKKTLAESESSSSYSYYQFPVTSFANDTIKYGDTVTFNLYIDYNKHVPVAPVLSVLYSKAGAADSIKVTRVIRYSQTAALANDNLSSLESYYSTAYKTTTAVFKFNSATYYPQTVADSITSSGFAYPSLSATRSVKYTITVIPLKSGAAVKVKDLRFKLYLQPAQFK